MVLSSSPFSGNNKFVLTETDYRKAELLKIVAIVYHIYKDKNENNLSFEYISHLDVKIVYYNVLHLF